MKKRILASVLALSSMALMFTGCGSKTSGGNDTGDAGASSSGEEVTLKV